MEKLKKIIIVATLIFGITSVSFANCRPDYQEDMSHRIEKMEKWSKAGKYSTGSIAGGVTLLIDIFGVAMVGPMGLLIGPQFGLLALLAVGTPFYIQHRMRKSKLKKLGTILQVIEESQGSEKTPVLEKMRKKLSKKHPELTKEKLSAIVSKLNNSRELCDGTIANYRKIFKRKKNKLATSKRLLKYISKEVL